jgi:hypothetical protein
MCGIMTHLFVSMALHGLISITVGWKIPSVSMMVAGLVAILVDLDRLAIPPGRTPITHSAILVPFWPAMALCIAHSCGLPITCSFEFSTAIAIAFTSHVILDIMDRNGIFLFPNTMRLRKVMSPLPRGARYRHTGKFNYVMEVDLVLLNRFHSGELSWPYWRRYRGRPLPRTDQYLISLSMLTLFILLIV